MTNKIQISFLHNSVTKAGIGNQQNNGMSVQLFFFLKRQKRYERCYGGVVSARSKTILAFKVRE